MFDPERDQPDPSDFSLEHSSEINALDEKLAGLPSLLATALASDKRERVIHYLEALLAIAVPERSPFHVSRERLQATQAFNVDELAQLSDEDLGEIGSRLQTHYREDWYPEEIVFHAQLMLDEKAKATTE